MTSPKTVLIIDDDPDYVKAISALLESAGYAVRAAANGTEGLRLARALPGCKGALERTHFPARLTQVPRGRFAARTKVRMPPTSFSKRQKEKERQDRAKEKLARRDERRRERAGRTPQQRDGEDPDIAGIVPGPQPPAEEEA